jgi:hypothetical protein
MKTDEVIDWIEILESENKVLRGKNNHLNQQVRRLKVNLESVLNILEPEQFRIIQKDLYELNHLTINQHA